MFNILWVDQPSLEDHKPWTNYVSTPSEVNQGIKSWNEVQVWADLCLDIENQRTKYQPDEFVKIVKETGDAIILHMNYTMPTLNVCRSPMLLLWCLINYYVKVDSLMERFEPQDLESFEASLAAKHQTERLPFSAAPLMIVNSDCTHNSWFPPVSYLGWNTKLILFWLLCDT